jgi:hypothetical protein
MPRSKNKWSYNSTPNTPSWRGAQLKHRDGFTLPLPYYCCCCCCCYYYYYYYYYYHHHHHHYYYYYSTRVYPKVSGLAGWSENCKWYSCLPLGAVV